MLRQRSAWSVKTPPVGDSGHAPNLREIVLGLVEPIQRVQRAHRKFGVGGVDQHRKLDLGRGDGANVDVAAGQRLERLGGCLLYTSDAADE